MPRPVFVTLWVMHAASLCVSVETSGQCGYKACGDVGWKPGKSDIRYTELWIADVPDRNTSTSALNLSRTTRAQTQQMSLPQDGEVVCLYWPTIAVWRETSRAMFAAVSSHLRMRYKAYVGPYVTKLFMFDGLLHAHGAIISGATALHFFIPDTAWSPRALDIYVPANTYKRFVRTVVACRPFGWTRISVFRKKKHAEAEDRFMFGFTGAAVDEGDDSLDEYLSDEEYVCNERRVGRSTRYRLEDSTSPVFVGGFMKPEAIRASESIGDGAEAAAPFGGAPAGDLLAEEDGAVRHSETSDADDEERVVDSTGAVSDADAGEDYHSGDVDYSSTDSEDSVHGDGRFLDPREQDLTDAWVQLRHYTPQRPTLVYGKGFRTMRSFRTETGKRVNVICSHSNSPVTPLRHFWSTLMFNFLTPDGCVCAFPSATLVRRGTTKAGGITEREQETLERYEDRGFLFEGDDLRSSLDVWDYIFVGEQRILAMDFRADVRSPRRRLPVKRTDRGWLPDDDWEIVLPANERPPPPPYPMA